MIRRRVSSREHIEIVRKMSFIKKVKTDKAAAAVAAKKAPSSVKKGAKVVEEAVIPVNDDALAQLTPAIRETIEKHVNPLIVQDAIKALLQYEKKDSSSSGKANLFSEFETKSILLQVEFNHYGTTLKNIKPVRVKIPHSFYKQSNHRESSDYEFNIAIVTKSDDKEAVANYFSQLTSSNAPATSASGKSFLPLNYAKNITVISLNDIKRDYKEYNSRKSLLKQFTHFYADANIILYLYNLLGKVFREHNRYPVPLYYNSTPVNKEDGESKPVSRNVDFAQIVKELHKNIYDSTYLYYHQKNIQFKIGYSNMPVREVAENILYGLAFLLEHKLSHGQWTSIKAIYLRTKDSPALPVYSHVNYELYHFLQAKLAARLAATGEGATSISGSGENKKRKLEKETPAVTENAPAAAAVSESAAATKKAKKAKK